MFFSEERKGDPLTEAAFRVDEDVTALSLTGPDERN